MKIKVFADTICGWCYIGHSRLNKALEEFKDIQFEMDLISNPNIQNLENLKMMICLLCQTMKVE